MDANRSSIPITTSRHPRFLRSFLGLVAAIAASLAAVSPCAAQSSFQWNNTSNTNRFWDLGGNWTPAGGPPGSADFASFNEDATYIVSFDSITATVTPDVGFLDVLAGNVTFQNEDLISHSFTVNEFLTLANGAQLTNNGLNLSVAGTTFIVDDGQLLIDGSHPAGSQFNASETFVSQGLLTFNNGATGSFSGPLNINVSNSNTATVNILGGSQVSAGSIFIGNGASQSATSSGSLLVQGFGSNITMSEGSTLTIGNSDGLGSHSVSVSEDATFDALSSSGFIVNTQVNRSGTLNVLSGAEFNTQGSIAVDGGANVESGGVLNSGKAIIGLFDGNDGFARVTGPGSQWNSPDLVVGDRLGQGALLVDSRGQITAGLFRIGANSGTGIVSVQGTGSQITNTGAMLIGTIDGGGISSGTLNIGAGGLVSTPNATLGGVSNTVGFATVTGAGSQWNSSGDLTVGREGAGTLDVLNGGQVSSVDGFVGRFTDSVGTVTVSGAGSQWNNTDDLIVGSGGGTGTLTISNGGQVNDGTGSVIGISSGSTGAVNVSGAGSQWNSPNIVVGENAQGSVLLEAGGQVSTDLLRIGAFSGTGNVTVRGNGSRVTNTGNIRIGVGSGGANGTLSIEAGGQVTNVAAEIGDAAGSTGTVNVTGNGSIWINSGDLTLGDAGVGTLNIQDFGVVVAVNGTTSIGANSDINISGEGLLDGGSFVIDGAGATLNIDDGVLNSSFVNIRDNGTANIAGGGMVDSTGNTVVTNGRLNVTGAGSTFHTLGDLDLGLDPGAEARMEITGGGTVISGMKGVLGVAFEFRSGSALIFGDGSSWQVANELRVGEGGSGTVEVLNGGLLTSQVAVLGQSGTADGIVTVNGTGSVWSINSSLEVGRAGLGLLNIENDGRVSVGGITSINSQSTVNLNGGRFEFGTTTHDDLTRINATSGSLAGTINISGINDLASFPALQNTQVDLTDVNLNNSGLLVGSQIMRSSLNNQASGELMTNSGQQAIFAGNLTNAGEVNNTGGVVRFEKSANNQAGAFVGGRGVFGAGEGWTNEGVMAFSGNTDILGDVDNLAGGQIVTSGGSTTTFFDDLIHNGAEIRTSAGSSSVIFGAASGAGAYGGAGTVFFEGDLRPGNSPDIVSFEGNVVLGTAAHSFFELGGDEAGLFDQMLVQGDLTLDGVFTVELLDGFQLGAHQEFLIADVGGDLSGQFSGLGQGDLVGNFGGRELFISYTAGGGNSVSLFTSGVPEPGTTGLLGLACAGILLRRRRN